MRLIIQPDFQAISKWAAAYIVSKINDFSPSTSRPYVLGLPTGAAPLGVYKEGMRVHAEGKGACKHVVTGKKDE